MLSVVFLAWLVLGVGISNFWIPEACLRIALKSLGGGLIAAVTAYVGQAVADFVRRMNERDARILASQSEPSGNSVSTSASTKRGALHAAGIAFTNKREPHT